MCTFRERHRPAIPGVFWIPHATSVSCQHSGSTQKLDSCLPAREHRWTAPSLTIPYFSSCSCPTSSWFHFKSNRSFCHCPTPKGAMNSWLCWIELEPPVLFTASKFQCCFLSIDGYCHPQDVISCLSKKFEGQKTVKPSSPASEPLQSTLIYPCACLRNEREWCSLRIMVQQPTPVYQVRTAFHSLNLSLIK